MHYADPEQCPYCLEKLNFDRLSSDERKRILSKGSNAAEISQDEKDKIPKHLLMESENDPIVRCNNCRGIFSLGDHSTTPIEEGTIPFRPLSGSGIRT